MSDSTIMFLVLGGVVIAFVTNRIPVAVVAMATALTLWATDLLTLEESLAGFGDPTVLLIAALFVVSESLDATGVTAWAGQVLTDRAGTQRTRILLATMLLCALISAAITPNASVAALVPVVVVVALRVGLPTSQMMIPLAFAAHSGALLALTGSPVSVIISNSAHDAGAGRFGFFEFALVGLPLLLGTITIVIVVGRRLLPHHPMPSGRRDISGLETDLQRHYRVNGEEGERLFGRRYGAAELIIPPRSAAIGQPVYPGMVTESGELVVMSVVRGGRVIDETGMRLEAGDTLLVRGTWRALSLRIAEDDAVMAVDPPDLVRRQAVPLGAGATTSIVVLLLMVVAMASNLLPPTVAGLVAAGVLILLRVVSIEQAFSAINWTTVVLVAGMIPLSTAMRSTGAAEKLADEIVGIVGDGGAIPLLVALFVLTAVMGQLISNTATALVMIPIALSAAVDVGVPVATVLMSVNVASTAALLTPVATPANLMVMEPGGYRFGDYWRIGLVVMSWYFVIAVVWVPVVWGT